MIGVLFLLGLVIGSFLNVVISRLGTRKPIVWGHSQCPRCHHPLATGDLIPVISYLFLAGRCRYCAKKVSLRYPAIELGTALLFGMVASKFSEPLDLVFWLFFVASFLVIVSFDIRTREIPHAILWPTFIGVLWYAIIPPLAFASQGEAVSILREIGIMTIFPGVLTGGVIFLLVVVTKEKAMGMGDVPLAAMQGLVLGYPQGMVALILSFVFGALFGIGLILTKRATLKTAVPFTPFLILGLLIIVFLEA